MLPVRLALLAVLSAVAQPALPPVSEELATIGDRARWISFDEDSDEDSFDIDGPEALPNFHMVHPGLYRSGQPNREGLAQLRALGVKTIVSLRNRISKEEREEAERLGMTVHHVSMSGIVSPKFKDLDRVLSIIEDPANQPALVHCRRGRDRTGTAVAAQRVVSKTLGVGAAADEAHRYGCCVPLFFPLKPYLAAYRRHRR
ncbi:MAG: tyrosine-protein phosphatase [Elusimicrobia bacterium]|nr:tyrosine-protein phosphatase [Elusimicrobiota bacterium]